LLGHIQKKLAEWADRPDLPEDLRAEMLDLSKKRRGA